ncbi:hypothetical protein GF402_11525 [Candidatus Fermentibacteria bacterium]|nr:hypothetical protein [Candidatus Fermentibacteria bacterium]
MSDIEGCREEDLVFGVCPGHVVPSEKRREIIDKLVEAEMPTGANVYVDKEESELVLLGVTAVDWPGLATIVLSELHHLGWNLEVLEGFAVYDNSTRRGYVITGIRNTDPERSRKFREDADRVKDLLLRLAEGHEGTVSLLGRATERLERFEEVCQALEKLYGDKEIPLELYGEKGEIVLFLSARSDQYLAERKPADLAWIVKTNYELVRSVREKGGKPAFKIRNLKTRREHLTGINIAGFERDISFQSCLMALQHGWNGATVKHQRRYTTDDGITSIRIEMTGPTGLSATREEQSRIRKTLKKLLVSHELEKLRRIHRYGGRESYARAIIPLLLRECESSCEPQAYIARVATSTFHAELKLLMVSIAADRKLHDKKAIDLVKGIDSKDGLTVASFKSPSGYGEKWVDIIDITIERDRYTEIEEAYNDIKEVIGQVFGKFRDFDMGMRLNDVSKVKELKSMLTDVPDHMVTDFYYRLEDFLRASAPIEDLARHVKLAFDSLSELFREGRDYVAPSYVPLGEEDDPTATLFCCTRSGPAGWFHDLLEVVSDYRVTASVVEWSGASAVLLRVQKEDGGGLSEEEIEEVLSGLSAHCCGAEAAKRSES